MSTPVPGKAIASTFFKLISHETYKCNLCDHDYKSKGTGHTNLKTHTQSKHPDAYNDFEQALQSGSTLDMSKYRYPKKTLRIHAWVEYVVMTLAPFRKVMCKYTRKNFKHEPIHLNTFYAYLDKLTKHVEEKIAKLLPDKFALVLMGGSLVELTTLACLRHFRVKRSHLMSITSVYYSHFLPSLTKTGLMQKSTSNSLSITLVFLRKLRIISFQCPAITATSTNQLQTCSRNN